MALGIALLAGHIHAAEGEPAPPAAKLTDKPARNPRIDKDLLAGIEQRRPMQGANRQELLSYNIVVRHAKEVSPKDLARIARKDISYAKLWEDPHRHVGEPVHITGQMMSLVRMDAPRFLQNDGVKTLYEGWVFPNVGDDGDNPYCVVFSELPEKVQTGERVSYRIACDAYFFKLYRYQTKARNKSGEAVHRDAPMFIGRSFVRTIRMSPEITRPLRRPRKCPTKKPWQPARPSPNCSAPSGRMEFSLPLVMAPKAPEAAPAPPLLLDDRARGPVVAVQVAAAGNGPVSASYLRARLPARIVAGQTEPRPAHRQEPARGHRASPAPPGLQPARSALL